MQIPSACTYYVDYFVRNKYIDSHCLSTYLKFKVSGYYTVFYSVHALLYNYLNKYHPNRLLGVLYSLYLYLYL